MKAILFALMTMFSASALAHEGHAHSPSVLKSQFGGVVKPGKIVHFEYVVNGNQLDMHLIAHEGEEMPKDVVISQVKAIPRGPKAGKSYNLEIKKAAQSYQAIFDLQGANRLPLEATIEAGGKKDVIKFQVEK